MLWLSGDASTGRHTSTASSISFTWIVVTDV
jgi:hypothetical protein